MRWFIYYAGAVKFAKPNTWHDKLIMTHTLINAQTHDLLVWSELISLDASTVQLMNTRKALDELLNDTVFIDW